MTRYWADHAWLGGDEVTDRVALEVTGDRITSVLTAVDRPAGAIHLAGVTLPGFANAHSHAFHRALRGRTNGGRGSFWTWREEMYAVAAALTPDSYYDLARATYAEMALAGVTTVGEFHYLHHPVRGRYADANAFGHALAAAATDAGLRLTLLDTCYLAGGFDTPPDGVQVRFDDGSADEWAGRVSALGDTERLRVGAAIHSVRAVPSTQLPVVAAWAGSRAAPLHFHLSEQQAENDDCRASTGCSPTELLDSAGALGPRSTAVHATRLTGSDINRLGGSATTVCLCPTTERDLADGIGPAGALSRSGSPLSVGSDSNAVIDLLEETRGLEVHERLAGNLRGNWSAGQLMTALTAAGQHSLGWPDAGQLCAGALADFVSVGLDSVRTAGGSSPLETVIYAATAGDVTDVVVGGRRVVSGGRHLLFDSVPAALRAAIAGVTA